jgi:hypothetical protein
MTMDVEQKQYQQTVHELRIPEPATRRQIEDLRILVDRKYLELHKDDPHLRDGVPYDDAWTVSAESGYLVVRMTGPVPE